MTCDLRTEPLIPVQTQHTSDGVALVGLRELLVRAHEYTDLAITIPPAAAGMLRVLYTITARITGIDQARTLPEFERLRAAAAARAQFDEPDVDTYLHRSDLENRWDLFDRKWPWLQDPRLVNQADIKPVNALDPTRPGANSPIWWQHTWNQHVPALSPGMALCWLLAHHWYGSGGTGGTREIGNKRDHHMSAGPLRGTVSFYPHGRTLFETLIAGVPAPGTAAGSGIDAAPWEIPKYPDPLSQPTEATWPAGLLTRQSRHAILLIPDQTGNQVTGCYLTWAYKKRHPAIADPYTIQDRRADGTWSPRYADSDRAIWRDVDALLADQVDHRRPPALTGTITLPDAWQPYLRVRVHGWDQDRQATDKMMFTGLTPVLLPWMNENDPEAADGASRLHAAAEDTATELHKSLRDAYRSLGTGKRGRSRTEVPWVAPADASYWPNAEALFWQLLHERRFDQPYRAYLQIALNAVDVATRYVAHHPPVARELANVTRHLRGFAAKKNPHTKDTADAH